MTELRTLTGTPGNTGSKQEECPIVDEPLPKCTPEQKRVFIIISRCSFIALVICLLTIPFIVGLELIPRQNWNENAETKLAEIVKHNVYVDAKYERARIMGYIYVNFPTGSESKFEICDKSGGWADESKYYTEKLCQKHLDANYAIGDEISVYYDPENHSDVRLDKKSLDRSIAGVVISLTIGLVWLVSCSLWCIKCFK